MFPGKPQSQSNQAAAAQEQPSMSAGQSSSSTAAPATTALEEGVVVKQLKAEIHEAVLDVRAQVMIVAGEPMTEKSTSEFNKLVKACLAVRNAQAALGEHYASRDAVSSALSLPVSVPPLPLSMLGSLVAATGTNGVSNTPPPLQRTTAALGGIVGAADALLAAAAAASDELTAATGIEAIDIDIEDDAPVSPTPDSSSSSSSLPPGTHVAGPRQALAAAPEVQQAAPSAPPAPASKSHP